LPDLEWHIYNIPCRKVLENLTDAEVAKKLFAYYEPPMLILYSEEPTVDPTELQDTQ
jgi:hypothetical protein